MLSASRHKPWLGASTPPQGHAITGSRDQEVAQNPASGARDRNTTAMRCHFCLKVRCTGVYHCVALRIKCVAVCLCRFLDMYHSTWYKISGMERHWPRKDCTRIKGWNARGHHVGEQPFTTSCFREIQRAGGRKTLRPAPVRSHWACD